MNQEISEKLVKLQLPRNGIPNSHLEKVCGEYLGVSVNANENVSVESNVVPGLTIGLNNGYINVSAVHDEYNLPEKKDFVFNTVRSNFENYQ